MHRMIVRLGWRVDVLLCALSCMHVQAIVHQMQAVDKSCSIAIAAEFQVTFGDILLH